jgi:FO synthase
MTAAGRQAIRQRFDAPLAELIAEAAALRDSAHGRLISYSRKVFIPLTKLCRDVCHYCTFAEVPRAGKPVYLSPDEVLAMARAGAAAGCTEALFTLGDKPELRYQAARDALKALGHETTISYLTAMCALVLRETGLLPHANPGVMTRKEIAGLREVTASQGIMLESTSERALQAGRRSLRFSRQTSCSQAGDPASGRRTEGSVHDRHPDRHRRDTRRADRRAGGDSGSARRPWSYPGSHRPELPGQARHQARQFRGTRSRRLLWTIATARLILGPDMNIQAPPNLSPGVYQKLIDAGLNDWGGISPVTPDHVNPEAPWPAIAELARKSADAGKLLVNRLPVYPAYVRAADTWLAPEIATRVRRMSDAEGFARDDDWAPGNTKPPPAPLVLASGVDAGIARIVERATSGERLASKDIMRLFAARDADYRHVTQAADALRRAVSGDVVRYVVNRNINYTNICYFRLQVLRLLERPHARGSARLTL